LMSQYGNDLSRTELDGKLGGHGWLTRKKNKLPLSLGVFNELKKIPQL